MESGMHKVRFFLNEPGGRPRRHFAEMIPNFGRQLSSNINRLKKNSISTGCSKRTIHKAPKFLGMRPSWVYAAVTRNEGNPATRGIDGPFSATC
jgi:hypothetical protein